MFPQMIDMPEKFFSPAPVPRYPLRKIIFR